MERNPDRGMTVRRLIHIVILSIVLGALLGLGATFLDGIFAGVLGGALVPVLFAFRWHSGPCRWRSPASVSRRACSAADTCACACARGSTAVRISAASARK
ncbi:hypothetical protein JCM13591A_05690 [Microbacterium xylanilyticum]